MAKTNDTTQGRGWHGDPVGHAKAGSKSSGKFEAGDERTIRAAKQGGKMSSGKFEKGSKRARDAGREGGKASH